MTQRKAFTLVELLVVIAIIGVVVVANCDGAIRSVVDGVDTAIWQSASSSRGGEIQ